MRKKNWFGLMKVLEIKQWRNGSIIWSEENIYNVLHSTGEQFVLTAVFAGGQNSVVIPSHYYLGLDNRSVVRASDTMDYILNEPGGNGYLRQGVSSSGDFTVALNAAGHYQATSLTVAFQAVGGSWGPVQNLFLTNKLDNSGFLISTAAFTAPLTVAANDTITMKIALSLKDAS